jgi:chemotaxis protein MotB
MAVTPGRNNEPQETEEETAEVSLPRTPRAVNADTTAGDGEKSFDPTGTADKPSDQHSHGQALRQAQAATDSKARISPDAKVLALVGTKSQAAANLAARAAADEAALQAEQDRRERSAFDAAAQQIRDSIHGDKLLEDLAKQVAIDETPEGLRIQLLDEDRKSMFPIGSSAMNDRARQLLQKVAAVLITLPEPISIAGHTDAAPYPGGGKTNWDLSSERANATRRILVDAGLQESRLRSVTGNADRDLLLPADPLAAVNRRIAIMVLRTPHPAHTTP